MIATTQTATIAANHDFDLRHGFETGPITAPVWLTGIWIALFIIRPWEILIPQLATIRFERLYALTVLGVVLASGLFRFRGSTQTIAVMLFIAALGLSTLFAYDTSIAWNEYYKYLTLAVFYFVLLSVIRTPYQLEFIIICYIASMALYLGKSQWEYFVHGRHGFTMGVSRLFGIESTFGNPNSVAGSTVVSLPFLQFLWWHRHTITRTWATYVRRWFPLFLVLYFILAVTSIILTNSRSGAINFTAFVILFGSTQPYTPSRIKRSIVAVLILVAIWEFTPETTKRRISTLWNPAAGPASAKGSADARQESFWIGLAMFSQKPLTGVGIGNTAVFRRAFVDGVYLAPHNFYGEVLGETGLIGAAAFVLVIGSLLVNIRATKVLASRCVHPTSSMLSDLARTCGYVIVLLLVSGMAGDGLRCFQWLWLAAFALLARDFSESIAYGEAELCDGSTTIETYE
jgi:O-antigen ligase